MRKKTAQPTRKHPRTSSSQPSGLIVNELKPGRSDGEKSAQSPEKQPRGGGRRIVVPDADQHGRRGSW